jgi:hypothetical protein
VADTWDTPQRDLERAAIVGLALSQLPEEQELVLRRELEASLGATFPSLPESLETLARLTRSGDRISQRTFGLQLLAKVARNRGTSGLEQGGNELRAYAEASVVEAQQIAEARARELRRAEAKEKATRTREERASEDRERAVDSEVRETAPEASDVEDLFPDAPPIEPAEDPAPPPPPAGGPTLASDDEEPQVNAVLQGLDAAATSDPSDGSAWDAFASTAGGVLQLDDREVNLPKCSDDQKVTVGGKEAYRVVTTWKSKEGAAHFADWTDARKWDTNCSLFYESVTQVDPANPAPDVEGYVADFTEVVKFTNTTKFTTVLTFTRTVRSPFLFALHFMLPPNGATQDIDVDTGSLVVRQDSDAADEWGTRLLAEKAISFTDPAMAKWPTLSCDLMWMELSILAALGCKLQTNP